VRLEVGGLSKALAAVVEGADIWPVSRVDANVGTQIEVQGKTLATPLKCALRTDVMTVMKVGASPHAPHSTFSQY